MNISQQLKEHYSNTFAQYGPTSMGVDWGSKEERATLRYEKMLNIIENKNQSYSLLDVGCGYGGLCIFSENQKFYLDYTGIDVAENMIKWANENIKNADFVCGDFMTSELNKIFDFIVCNGILTQKLNVSQLEMEQFAKKMIIKMFKMAKKGIAFNLMTTKVNFFAQNLFYKNPVEMFAFCMEELSPKIRIDHSYPLFEYTVYVMK